MPTAALRPCATCHRAGCTVHVRPAWGHARPVQRIRGRRLQRMRDRLFSRQPLCVLCLKAGRTAIATIRDHIIPLEEGGQDNEANEQAICADCHRVKTQAEALRGRERRR